ncbi:MAG: hypothetical protein ABWK01_02965 [Infirmifilum sp.]
MSRVSLFFLMLILGIVIQTHSTILAYLLYSFALLLIAHDLYTLVLFTMYSGCPLEEIKCLKRLCYNASKRHSCAYLGLRVIDCKHGCYDLDEKEFWLRSLSFFTTAFTSGGEFLIFIKGGEMYIVTKVCIEFAEKTHQALLSLHESLLRGLELLGCKAELLEGLEVKSLLRPDMLIERKADARRYLPVLVFTFIATRIFPPLIVVLLLELVALTARRQPIYHAKLEKGAKIYGLKNTTVTFAYPTLSEIFTRARVFYATARSIDLLAFKIKPATWEASLRLDSHAYKVYELGTALDKLSMLHESQKYFFASRRRWERREPVFLASGLLLARKETRELLERMGIHFTPNLLALKTLE